MQATGRLPHPNLTSSAARLAATTLLLLAITLCVDIQWVEKPPKSLWQAFGGSATARTVAGLRPTPAAQPPGACGPGTASVRRHPPPGLFGLAPRVWSRTAVGANPDYDWEWGYKHKQHEPQPRHPLVPGTYYYSTSFSR